MLSSLPRDDRRGVAAYEMLINECDQGTRDLQIVDIRQEFEEASIENHVGYSEETISRYARMLNSINARLPPNHQYDEDHMAVKLLCAINHPESLALEAVTELNAVAGARRFEHLVNNAQVRDYGAIKNHFDAISSGI